MTANWSFHAHVPIGRIQKDGGPLASGGVVAGPNRPDRSSSFLRACQVKMPNWAACRAGTATGRLGGCVLQIQGGGEGVKMHRAGRAGWSISMYMREARHCRVWRHILSALQIICKLRGAFCWTSAGSHVVRHPLGKLLWAVPEFRIRKPLCIPLVDAIIDVSFL